MIAIAKRTGRSEPSPLQENGWSGNISLKSFAAERLPNLCIETLPAWRTGSKDSEFGLENADRNLVGMPSKRVTKSGLVNAISHRPKEKFDLLASDPVLVQHLSMGGTGSKFTKGAVRGIGRVASPQSVSQYIPQSDGRNALRPFGRGIRPLARNAGSRNRIAGQHRSTFIILCPLRTDDCDSRSRISCCFASHAITGFTVQKTSNVNS